MITLNLTLTLKLTVMPKLTLTLTTILTLNLTITKETPPVEVKIGNHVEELQFDIIHAPQYLLIL